MRLSELARIVHGDCQGVDADFNAVSIDTRMLQAGDLYIAIAGQRFDGHDFLPQAVAQGACAALVQRFVDSELPQVRVEDTRLALGKLGAAWRDAFPGKVVGLTGSNGKTTAKEMIAAILAVNAEILSTKGNLNNDLGVPLTLLRLMEAQRFAVVEMGANHIGEIAYTAALARPDVALITNAGMAHLEGFGSREGIAQGKGEIITALPANGTAILNADDVFFGYWRGLAGSHRVISFGFGENADVRGVADSVKASWQGDQFKTCFQCAHQGQVHDLALNLAGRHNVANGLAATAVALALGIGFEQVRQGLGGLFPVAGRVQPGRAANGALLINDTYNANPSSFQAALEVLLDMPGEPWVALGAFGELGQASAELHADLGRLARQAGVRRLFATGPLADRAVQAFGTGASYFPAQDALIAAIQQEIRPDVALLVKGSRSQKMEQVVAALQVGG